ncbi:MAG: hypothetical protein ABEH81_04100 [Halopenitus sp.]
MVDFSQFLASSRICNNCFRRLRREAVRHRTYKPDETYDERLRWQTSVDDVPGAVVSESAAVFCECGVEGPFDRSWCDYDVVATLADKQEVGVDRDKFRELLKAALATASQLGLVETRSEATRVSSTAWDWFDAGASVNRTFREAFATIPDRTSATSSATGATPAD